METDSGKASKKPGRANFEGRRAVLIGGAANLIGGVGNKLLAIIIFAILIKSLSVEDFGRFNLFVATAFFLGSLAFGLDKIVQRYFPQSLADSISKAVALMVVFGVKRYAVLATVVFFLWLSFDAGILNIARLDVGAPILVLVAAAVVTGHLLLALTVNAAFMDNVFLNASMIGTQALKVFWLLAVWDGSFIGALWIWLAGELLLLFLVTWRLLDRLQLRWSNLNLIAGIRALEMKRYYKYGRYQMFANMSSLMLAADLEYFFLSYFRGSEDVALYAFAVKIPLALLMLAPSNLFFNVVLPIFFKRVDSGDNVSRLAWVTQINFKLNITVWALISTLAALNAAWVIGYFFDSRYLVTLPLVQIWILIFTVLVIKNVFEPVARALEYGYVYIFFYLAATLNVILDLILIPILGIYGAIGATGCAMIIQGLGLSLMVARRLDLQVSMRASAIFGLKLLALFACVYIVPWALSKFFVSYFFQMVMANMILLLVFFVLFWPSKVFRADELAFLLRYAPWRRANHLVGQGGGA